MLTLNLNLVSLSGMLSLNLSMLVLFLTILVVPPYRLFLPHTSCINVQKACHKIETFKGVVRKEEKTKQKSKHSFLSVFEHNDHLWQCCYKWFNNCSQVASKSGLSMYIDSGAQATSPGEQWLTSVNGISQVVEQQRTRFWDGPQPAVD